MWCLRETTNDYGGFRHDQKIEPEMAVLERVARRARTRGGRVRRRLVIAEDDLDASGIGARFLVSAVEFLGHSPGA
jgi:hypothetical protein